MERIYSIEREYIPFGKRIYSFKNQEHLLEFIGAVIEYQNISHHHGKIIIDVNNVIITIIYFQ